MSLNADIAGLGVGLFIARYACGGGGPAHAVVGNKHRFLMSSHLCALNLHFAALGMRCFDCIEADWVRRVSTHEVSSF